MDIYDASLKRLRADSRTPEELAKVFKMSEYTIRDIKRGICKDPRHSTVRRIALGYFPHEKGRKIAA